jgi:NADPH:quinone reductase
MRAWQVAEWCGPEGMRLNQVDAPEAGHGQVLIRNRAASLNFFDLLQIQGKYQVKPALPFTPGAEVAGVVEAVGADVANFAVGDRVLAFTSGGGYADSTVTDSFRTFRIPDGMSYEQAAALPIVYHTSWFALKQRAGLKPGDWLLVHAGASGVGMSAIQIGEALGAQVIATAGEDRKLEFALAQGADYVIDYNTPDWVDRVKEITGRRGVDVVYDPVGGDVFDLSIKCMAAEGRVLVIGFAGGRIPAIQTNRLLLKNISVVGVFWGDYANARPLYMSETQTALDGMFTAGQIRPVVGRRYSLEQAPDALRDLAGRKIAGKAVIDLNNGENSG